jgi:hypothetical protein
VPRRSAGPPSPFRLPGPGPAERGYLEPHYVPVGAAGHLGGQELVQDPALGLGRALAAVGNLGHGPGRQHLIGQLPVAAEVDRAGRAGVIQDGDAIALGGAGAPAAPSGYRDRAAWDSMCSATSRPVAGHSSPVIAVITSRLARSHGRVSGWCIHQQQGGGYVNNQAVAAGAVSQFLV